jgi:hypothetical protein
MEPETYLRMAWERIALSDERRGGSNQIGTILAASRVLAASGSLDARRAAAIGADYQHALRLREGNMHHFFPGQGSQQRIDLSIRRVALCATDFVAGATPMTLSQVIFTDDSVLLEVSGSDRTDATPAFRRQARMMGVGTQIGTPAHGPTLVLHDDSGGTATALWSGSSSGGRNWDAHFKSDAPLNGATKWLEIDGARIDLPEPRPVPSVRVEHVDADSSLRTALRRELVNDLQMHGPSLIDAALGALIETGAIGLDDPLVKETQQVAAAVHGHQLLPGLSEPWASLLRRTMKNDGILGRLPIGVAVVVDDISIRFDSLVSESHAFSVALAVSPGSALLRHAPWQGLELSPIEWWAEDDRGNGYLLSSGNGGGSSHFAEGMIQSLTPLDPLASELRILPTGIDERAVITISLSDLVTE